MQYKQYPRSAALCIVTRTCLRMEILETRLSWGKLVRMVPVVFLKALNTVD